MKISLTFPNRHNLLIGLSIVSIFSLSSSCKNRIHLVNLLLVDLLCDVPLHFKGGREDVVFNREGLLCQVDLLRYFQVVKFLFYSHLGERINDKLGVLFLVLVDFVNLFSICFSPSLKCLIIRDDNSDSAVFV